MYGVQESNPQSADDIARREAIAGTARLDDPDLVKIHRLRFVSDPGFPVWDFSYGHGELKDGTMVHLLLPVSQFPKRNLSRAIIQMCKEAGVYGKGLGILDAVSTLC